ncbi:DUF1294 domain-containing protein [Oceanimonas baumannii]|uniref:Uncharacterized protein n=1 Tax=Oceanimonas baumannii TaxID=129578 RepID=A0A235CKN5_9GAMM|nr:hypothetical protein B6S09_07265 [Oceanimonas baumannii]
MAKGRPTAPSSNWRTSEKTLHLFSLLGGWPSARLCRNP